MSARVLRWFSVGPFGPLVVDHHGDAVFDDGAIRTRAYHCVSRVDGRSKFWPRTAELFLFHHHPGVFIVEIVPAFRRIRAHPAHGRGPAHGDRDRVDRDSDGWN